MTVGTPVKQGTTIYIRSYVHDIDLEPVTGASDIYISIFRTSDELTYDFNDSTFKAYGSCTTPQQAMTEIDGTNYPGQYRIYWTTPTVDEVYEVTVNQVPKTTVVNVVQLGEIIVGGWVDDVDAAISSRAAPGDEMDLVIGAVDAAAVATDAIDSDSIAASAVTEIQSGLATSAEVSTVQGDVTSILTDTAEMQGKLPTNNLMGSSDKDDHDTQIEDVQSRLPTTLNAGRMRSYVEVMDSDVVGSTQIATDAIDADAIATTAVNEIRDSILSDSTPFDGANIDVALSAILAKFDELPTHSLEMSFSYDPSTDTFSCNVWLEYANLVVINSGELQLDVYDQDRTLQFSLTSLTPDAGGVFKVTQTPTGLVKNKGYYAEAEVTLPAGGGTVRGIKGMFTVG